MSLIDGNALGVWTPEAPNHGSIMGLAQKRPATGDPLSLRAYLAPADRYDDPSPTVPPVPRAEVYAIPQVNGVPQYVEYGQGFTEGFWFYVEQLEPTSADPTAWTIIHQVKGRNTGSPPFSIEFSGSGKNIRLKRNLNPTATYWQAPRGAYTGRWVRFDLSYGSGALRLQLDGTTVYDGTARMFETGDRLYPKLGVYGSESTYGRIAWFNGYRLTRV